MCCILVIFGFERTSGLLFKIALALDMTPEAPGVFKKITQIYRVN